MVAWVFLFWNQVENRMYRNTYESSFFRWEGYMKASCVCVGFIQNFLIFMATIIVKIWLMASPAVHMGMPKVASTIIWLNLLMLVERALVGRGTGRSGLAVSPQITINPVTFQMLLLTGRHFGQSQLCCQLQFVFFVSVCLVIFSSVHSQRKRKYCMGKLPGDVVCVADSQILLVMLLLLLLLA